jgi:hypothetical protein
VVLLATILVLEGVILYLGQRYIFPRIENYSRKLALFLSAPGTALHEGAHWLMCQILFVPTGRVELFRPRESEDGGTQLGVVYHAETDPLRQTLVAIAPLLLVPPLLLLLLLLFLGSGVLQDPLQAFFGSAIWVKIILFYIFLSAGSAAFPSPGDHIPWFGAVLLLAGIMLFFFLIPLSAITPLLQIFVLLFAPAALSALLQLLLLRLIRERLE